MPEDFENLVHKYQNLVLHLIRRHYGGGLQGQEEDLAQEIWTKLWQGLKKNENNVVNFKSYLYRVVQTTLWDAVETLKKQAPVNEPMPEEETAPESAPEQPVDRLALDTLVAKLKPEEARMIKAHLKGFSNEEIAVLLGTTEGRVRNLLTRIKKKLAELGG